MQVDFRPGSKAHFGRPNAIGFSLRLIASFARRAFLPTASRKIPLHAFLLIILHAASFSSVHARPDRRYFLLHQREALITSLLSLNICRGEPTIEASSDSHNKWDVKAHLSSHSDTVIIHFWHKIDNSAQNRHNIIQTIHFMCI